MYTIADVVEMGEAHELILSEIKEISVLDDSSELTMEPLEYFDE
jgi:hypothetical protein